MVMDISLNRCCTDSAIRKNDAVSIENPLYTIGNMVMS